MLQFPGIWCHVDLTVAARGRRPPVQGTVLSAVSTDHPEDTDSLGACARGCVIHPKLGSSFTRPRVRGPAKPTHSAGRRVTVPPWTVSQMV